MVSSTQELIRCCRVCETDSNTTPCRAAVHCLATACSPQLAGEQVVPVQPIVELGSFLLSEGDE